MITNDGDKLWKQWIFNCLNSFYSYVKFEPFKFFFSIFLRHIYTQIIFHFVVAFICIFLLFIRTHCNSSNLLLMCLSCWNIHKIISQKITTLRTNFTSATRIRKRVYLKDRALPGPPDGDTNARFVSLSSMSFGRKHPKYISIISCHRAYLRFCNHNW